WGGNTMTINGTIEAGTLWEAERMDRDFCAAFGTLVEAPLKLNWWDVHDDFSDAATSSAFWQTLTGSAASFPGDGTMRFPATTAAFYYAKRQYIDHIVTAKFSMPVLSTQNIYIMSKVTSNTSGLEVGISSSGLLLCASFSGGTIGGAPSVAITPGVNYWLQMICIGD